MIHPSTTLKFIDGSVGHGVFATAFIPAGTITYVKDELEIVVSPDQLSNYSAPMQELIDKYSYIDYQGNMIVSWDLAKYVNHCCNCNTISTGYGFEIAIRDIHPGEEITDEYGIFNLPYEMAVSCGDANCRRIISKKDIDKYHPVWDEQIKQALAKLYSVEQPLMQLLDEETRSQVEDYCLHGAPYKSVLTQKLMAEAQKAGK